MENFDILLTVHFKYIYLNINQLDALNFIIDIVILTVLATGQT